MILFLLLLAGCTSQGNAVYQRSDTYVEGKPDFRKAYWGMSQEAVKSLETSTPIGEQKDQLIYDGLEAAGMSARCVYLFSEDKLYQGIYFFYEEHDDYNIYIDDYNNCKTALNSVYGNPVADKIYWIDESLKNDTKSYGRAISRGQLEYISMWQTETTEIMMVLSGGDDSIFQVINYRDKTFVSGVNTDGL